MRMTGQNRDTVPRLPIPDSYGLVISARYDPRMFMMKKHSSNEIQVTGKSKRTSAGLVIPDFDFEIVTP